jgi:hypothetical protein
MGRGVMAARMAALPDSIMTEAQVKIPDQGVGLGLQVEPPDGIEPSTYALRVRRSTV